MTLSSSYPTRIAFAEAVAILDQVAARHELISEATPLSRALGRVLAEHVVATVDLPGFDNSAMDGFALRSADLQPAGPSWLTLVGEQFAGPARGLALGAGECVRITTGASLPAGADAVLIKENATFEGGRVRIEAPVPAGSHVRRAGEDLRAGDRVLDAGQALSPAALSLAAAIGLHDLPVHRRPTVAVFTTGDELKAPGQPLAAGEIYDSNRVLLQTLLMADGFEPVAWPVLPDDPARIQAALRDAAFSFDVVITCGGVSAGEKDFLPALLAEHGEIHFWKVRMRPGMPMLAGRLGNAQLLCLPGNPVAVLATYLTLARRFLDGLQGRAQPRPRQFARLSMPVHKAHDRLEFLRGSLHCDASGQLLVQPNPADGSHRLRAAASSNALIVVPEGVARWEAGSVLEVLALADR
jgi:molybdopterin molybdotransferase